MLRRFPVFALVGCLVRAPDTVRWRCPEGPIRAVILASVLILPYASGPMALLDEVVHQFAGAVVHLDVERLHLTREVVERHNGRDGDEKTERRRYQSLRDTACNCADTGGLLRCNLLEGVQNTDHGAEQSDKRGRRTDRGQTAQTALQLRVNDRLRALERTLGALDLLRSDAAAGTEAAELLQTGRNDLRQVRLLRAVGNLDRLIQTPVLQRTGNLWGKLARLLAGSGEIKGPIDDHSERPDRHDEEKDDDAARQPAHIAPKTHDTETDLGLLEVHREGSGNVIESCCKMSENHWNISSWVEL